MSLLTRLDRRMIYVPPKKHGRHRRGHRPTPVPVSEDASAILDDQGEAITDDQGRAIQDETATT